MMSYTVEVRVVGGDLPASMSQMRSWLDHNRCEPDAFRYSAGTPTTTFRVDFKRSADAAVFAEAFGGRILGVAHPGESWPGAYRGSPIIPMSDTAAQLRALPGDRAIAQKPGQSGD